jgi:hypothetical protein
MQLKVPSMLHCLEAISLFAFATFPLVVTSNDEVVVSWLCSYSFLFEKKIVV